jgi:hypothetical protein
VKTHFKKQAVINQLDINESDWFLCCRIEAVIRVDIKRYGRYWAVYDISGLLVCVTVYKKGAAKVAKLLTERQPGFHNEGGEETERPSRTE